VEYATFSTATLGDVDDGYYYALDYQSCLRSARISLTRLRGLLGGDFPMIKVRTRLKCSVCGSKELTVTFLAPNQAVGSLASLFNKPGAVRESAHVGRESSPCVKTRPLYGEAIMNAVSIEAKAVLAFMEDVHKLRALSAEVGATDPTSAARRRTSLICKLRAVFAASASYFKNSSTAAKARPMIESAPQNICGWLSMRNRN
jgi:hypothetical protein